jgi:hypothetical protein
MLKQTRDIAGGLEEGLEGGIWGGVKGALIGYMTLPVVAGIAAAVFSGGLIGAGLFGGGVWVGLAAGAVATAAVAVVGYPINKQIAKFGGLLGGVVGFASGVDEPEGKTIQLSPEQDVMIVPKAQLHAQQAGPNTLLNHDKPQQVSSPKTVLMAESASHAPQPLASAPDISISPSD